ncbi:hypothetical protein [Archangium primigenium]|uniref:hypothetical protein n=1 Tax=[Archangium] primigenium TaxID=2792470 RepID=UPI001957E3E7|nr:hypothetical protein [Archangium primigenium]MBM7118093.1 hypothetical protein [Archangium primigenium]
MKNTSLAVILISAGLCAATSARAQAAHTGVPAAPTDATRPPPSPPAAQDEENVFRFYGTFNPRLVVSSGAVESFSQPNASAISAAGNPVFSNAPDQARYTLQVAQSRVGFWLNEKGLVRAQLELDFIDFAKASPTVASLPRVRIARVDYALHPNHLVSLGQDWDLHAPINPHGINMVGSLFLAGNTAFMRQQLKYIYSTPDLEWAAAVGFPSANVTAKDAAFELGLMPTLAARGTYKWGKSRVGLSALATRLPFNLGTPDERFRPAWSTALFSELAPTVDTNIRLELNLGQNGANLGMLTLAQGRATEDVREFGGFISARQTLSSHHAVYGMAGYQRVLEPAKVVPSYGYASPGTPEAPPAFSTATLSGTGPGILHNGTARLGYEFRPHRKLAFVLEGFLFQTRFRLQEVDVARVEAKRTTVGLETGALLTF